MTVGGGAPRTRTRVVAVPPPTCAACGYQPPLTADAGTARSAFTQHKCAPRIARQQREAAVPDKCPDCYFVPLGTSPLERERQLALHSCARHSHPPCPSVCPDCGFTPTGKMQGIRDRCMRVHVCARYLAKVAARERGKIDRTPKPCVHVPPHRHGTSQCYATDKCRCLPCQYAASERRTRQGQSFVDATPAREHVNALRAQGMSAARIADVSGVGMGCITALIGWATESGPSRRMLRGNSDALLAVRFTIDSLSDWTLVPSLGSQRRVQALAADGWTMREVAQRAGMREIKFMHADKVRKGTVVAIARVYAELAGTDGGNTKTRRFAARQGWLSPGWWDDDTIDDPDFEPVVTDAPKRTSDVDPYVVACAIDGHRIRLTRAERILVVVALVERGIERHTIADQIGTSKRQVERDIDEYRHQERALGRTA